MKISNRLISEKLVITTTARKKENAKYENPEYKILNVSSKK